MESMATSALLLGDRKAVQKGRPIVIFDRFDNTRLVEKMLIHAALGRSQILLCCRVAVEERLKQVGKAQRFRRQGYNVGLNHGCRGELCIRATTTTTTLLFN